jgi:hypothetical protein
MANYFRKLPNISLAGTEFTIDVRCNELRQTERPWNIINLDDLEAIQSDTAYRFLFDTKTKELYRGEIEKRPASVVCLVIPSSEELDPIGMARRMGMDDNSFLDDFSAKPLHIAKQTNSFFADYPVKRNKRLSKPPSVMPISKKGKRR